ncbi:MAG: hypothetical protein KDA45_11245 [Planctomycetales bacterium]|nr:hypothetical protein [Planctomycetales bacterium]
MTFSAVMPFSVPAPATRYWLWLVLIFLLPSPPLLFAQELPTKPAASYLKLHPENPRYLEWLGEPTLLVTSGEHYGALLNLDFDYERYFDELQRHGLNHTRVFSGVYREDAKSFNITDNTLAPKENRYISPWARSSQPGYHAGGNRFDLSRWDQAYFTRLKEFMAAAAQRGIVVELTLFCPMYNETMWDVCPMNSQNNINNLGKCPRKEVYTLQHPALLEVQLAVTRKIVSELRNFGNLYYEICNEPYFGGVTMEWQHKIVDAIVEAEKGFPQQHLISLNVANGRAKVDQPHPAVSIFNFHYCTPPDTVAMNRELNRVIGENETGFRGQEDILYRTEGWDFLLAGGGLYNNLDYSFTAAHPDGSLEDYKSPGGGSRALRQQLGILKDFLNGFDYIHMQSDPSVVSSMSPELTKSVLKEEGQAYAIYLHVPLPPKPKPLAKYLKNNIAAKFNLDLPAGQYDCSWLEPVTGKVSRTEQITHAGGTREFNSPRFDNDIALSVTRQQAADER